MSDAARIDDGVSSVFRDFPGDSWRGAPLREVVQSALGQGEPHQLCRACRIVWPASWLDDGFCLRCMSPRALRS